MKLYITGVQNQQTERGKSVREQLQHKISEQEKINSQLRLEYQQLKENLPKIEQQVKYWEKIEKYYLMFLQTPIVYAQFLLYLM